MPDRNHEINPYRLQEIIDQAETELHAVLARALNEQSEVMTRMRKRIAGAIQDAREAQQ